MKLTAKYILLAEFLNEVPEVLKGYCGGGEIPPLFPLSSSGWSNIQIDMRQIVRKNVTKCITYVNMSVL